MGGLDQTLGTMMGYRLRRSSATMIATMKPVFAKFGLRRATFSTLVVIVDHPGLRQSQIAAALDIERPNMVQIIDDLERAGWVERRKALDDKRAYALHATDAGQDLYVRALDCIRAFDAQLFSGLAPDEYAALNRAFVKLEENAKLPELSDGY